jgi:hypothetical protein
MPWLASENAPEITACEAITVAAVAKPIIGNTAQSGSIMKKGLAAPSGCAIKKAAWPN